MRRARQVKWLEWALEVRRRGRSSEDAGEGISAGHGAPATGKGAEYERSKDKADT